MEIEQRRRKAMRMLQRGVAQVEVARTFEVSRQTVSRWAKILEQDSDAWRGGERGRPARLTEKQLQRLDRLIRAREPQEHGYAQYRWSVALVRDLIEREFGVRYASITNVRRILRGMDLFPGYGWTRGMMYRARQRWVRDGKLVPW